MEADVLTLRYAMPDRARVLVVLGETAAFVRDEEPSAGDGGWGDTLPSGIWARLLRIEPVV